MSIFDTEEELTALQQKVRLIKQQARGTLSAEKMRCKASFDLFWRGLETTAQVQELLDAFGTDALQLFLVHRAWQEFIVAADPSYVPIAPPFLLTYNADGTVIAGDKL